jgi:hypothetical protein
MASDLAKLEGRLTTGSTAYSMTVSENGGGGVAVDVLAADTDYYPTSTTSFLTTIGTALTASASLAGTYTATISDSTSGTGKVTLAVSGGGVTQFAVTWTNTTLRDALGFTGNLTGTTTYDSQSACPYIWLPNQRRTEPMVPEGYKGFPIVDTTITQSPSGHSVATYWATRYSNNLAFRFLTGNKVWRASESVTNESLQSFFETCIAPGNPVRYHYDRDVDATYVTWRLMPQWNVRPEIPGFVGRGSDGSSTYWSYSADCIELVE